MVSGSLAVVQNKLGAITAIISLIFLFFANIFMIKTLSQDFQENQVFFKSLYQDFMEEIKSATEEIVPATKEKKRKSPIYSYLPNRFF